VAGGGGRSTHVPKKNEDPDGLGLELSADPTRPGVLDARRGGAGGFPFLMPC